MALTSPKDILGMIKSAIPPHCANLLDQRDGAFRVVEMLRHCVDPSETAEGQSRVWDSCARFYAIQGRLYEALMIYRAMYSKLMELQQSYSQRKHKGTPLVRLSEVHSLMGNPLLAKRYIMLTICEDAIQTAGNIPIDNTGSYFRAVWQHGISDENFHRYARDAWTATQKQPEAMCFPEWALQELDQNWMTEYASTSEASVYVANSTYCVWLLSKLGSGDGKALERLGHYLLNCVPGFRAKMRTRTYSTDYDVYCAIEGPTYDFRSELGRYFICECKDWDTPADVTTVLKFSAVLRAAKCRFGIIFSKCGISGRDDLKDAKRELLKLTEGGIFILIVTESNLKDVAKGANFFSMLRDQHECSHLDLI
jgi:hypothetical protein